MRIADKGAAGKRIVDWQRSVNQKWAGLRFGEVKVTTDAERHIFIVEVYLNDLLPNAITVELYADGINGGAAVRQEMKRVRELDATSGRHAYSAAVSAARPPSDYTARVIPDCDGVAVPLEAAQILWQR